jgi:hypothetical protein
MRPSHLAAIAFLLVPAPALASASLYCTAEDKSVRFSAEAVVSHGVGEQVPQFSGELAVLMKDAPQDFRSVALGLEQLTQKWLHNGEVKLRLYRDLEGDKQPGSVELVVETKRVPQDETAYRGTYTLTVSTPPEGAGEGAAAKTLKARGRAGCSLG